MLWGSAPMAHGHGAPQSNATLQGNTPPPTIWAWSTIG